MPEEQRNPNSALFSLQELKKLEDSRVEQEQQAARSALEAQKKARLDAEARVRDDEARKIREAQEAEQRAQDARLHADREERIRVEGAERQARIDAEARLREEQIRLEIKAKQEGKKIWPWVLGVTVVLLAVGGGIFYKVQSDAAAEREKFIQQIIKQDKEAEDRYEELASKMKSQSDSLEKQLSAAVNDTERQKIMAARDALKEQARREREAEQNRRDDAREKAKKAGAKGIQDKFKKLNIGDDPLDGL